MQWAACCQERRQAGTWAGLLARREFFHETQKEETFFEPSAERNTPANAGKSGISGRERRKHQDHPPRGRGKDRNACLSCSSDRITPAWAGKSVGSRILLHGAGDHPRVCGEKTIQFAETLSKMGSPPRVRGKGPASMLRTCFEGITPACAGKSAQTVCRWFPARDHPRVCGEKRLSCQRSKQEQGSPPRVRGKAGFARSAPRR